MSEELRKALGCAIPAHVDIQSGEGTNAPSALFADADYEVGDGTCGLHESAKQANEPAIVYVRADVLEAALAAALAQIEALQKGGEGLQLGKMAVSGKLDEGGEARIHIDGWGPGGDAYLDRESAQRLVAHLSGLFGLDAYLDRESAQRLVAHLSGLFGLAAPDPSPRSRR